MYLKYIISITICILISACASTNYEQSELVQTQPILSIQNKTGLNELATVQKNEFLIELFVKPAKIAKVSDSTNVDTVGVGQFNIRKGDHFFPAKSKKFGTVYCGYNNLYSNSIKTVLNQGCLGDLDKNGDFETFMVRAGSIHKDVPRLFKNVTPRFIYHDAEIVQVATTADHNPIVYTTAAASEKHAYRMAFKLRRIKKRRGVKYAVFDIVTKRPKQENWVTFSNRDPIEVKFPKNTTTANFTTPMFTVELSNLTNKSVDAVITSVESQSGFGYLRALKNDDIATGRFAYQITG